MTSEVAASEMTTLKFQIWFRWGNAVIYLLLMKQQRAEVSGAALEVDCGKTFEEREGGAFPKMDLGPRAGVEAGDRRMAPGPRSRAPGKARWLTPRLGKVFPEAGPPEVPWKVWLTQHVSSPSPEVGGPRSGCA